MNASGGNRKLVAIMFADIFGYTAIMQDDEERAKLFRKKFRTTIDKLVKVYNGEIIQYMGDGALVIFYSGYQAVECAVEIQHCLNDEPKVPLRIGLHIGDVVIDEDGIYGDSVNVSSRIESLSVPGGILLSEKLYDEIKNHKNIKTKSLGEFDFKNVKNKIVVYAVINEGITVPESDKLEGKLNKAEKKLFKTSVFLKSTVDDDFDNMESLIIADEYLNKFNCEDTFKAYQLYHIAVKENPGSAAAKAGLSLCSLYLGMNNFRIRDEFCKLARDYAIKAFELNPKTLMPNIAMAMTNLFVENNPKMSFKSFMNCFSISIKSKKVNLYYTYYLLAVNKIDEALQSLTDAGEQTEALSLLFSIYTILGQFEKAREIIDKIKILGCKYVDTANLYETVLLLAKGDYNFALKHLNEYETKLQNKENIIGYQCIALKNIVGLDNAKIILTNNLTLNPDYLQRAIAYNVLNETDKAKESINLSLQLKEPGSLFVHINPFLKGLS